MTASVGVAMADDTGTGSGTGTGSIDDAVSEADTSAYTAKRAGGNGVHVADPARRPA